MSSHRREQFMSGAKRPRARVSPNAAIVTAALVFVAAAAYATRGSSDPGSTFTGVGDRGGDVSFALRDFADGRAKFFRYVTAAGTEVRFFVMRSSDGVTRAAFDTCDVCFKERRGYRQAGDAMICNNCGQSFDSHAINEVRGGCNPAPIEREIRGERIVLRAAALEQGASYF